MQSSKDAARHFVNEAAIEPADTETIPEETAVPTNGAASRKWTSIVSMTSVVQHSLFDIDYDLDLPEAALNEVYAGGTFFGWVFRILS